MRLIHVRKGQFVYYKNRLHKVYAVQHFFKQSVHLIRLADLEQSLATAKEITYYQPQHLDSFIWNHQRFTLHRDKEARVGDYILVINPRPDSLDRHYLHAIEIVSSIEVHGIISNQANGIKHNEYWVMLPGQLDGANVIDWQHPDQAGEDQEAEEIQDEFVKHDLLLPRIGDIYQDNTHKPVLQVQVTAIEGETVYLGNGTKVETFELMDERKWSRVMNALEQ